MTWNYKIIYWIGNLLSIVQSSSLVIISLSNAFLNEEKWDNCQNHPKSNVSDRFFFPKLFMMLWFWVLFFIIIWLFLKSEIISLSLRILSKFLVSEFIHQMRVILFIRKLIMLLMVSFLMFFVMLVFGTFDVLIFLLWIIFNFNLLCILSWFLLWLIDNANLFLLFLFWSSNNYFDFININLRESMDLILSHHSNTQDYKKKNKVFHF